MRAGETKTVGFEIRPQNVESVTLAAASWATMTYSNGTGTITFTPPASASGQYTITITASNARDTSSGVIRVLVY